MIKLVVDSASDITKEEAERLGITMIPMNISFGEGHDYFDGVNLLPEKFYPMLEESTENPKTSQITTYRFTKVFEELTSDGSQVISIIMSSKLSGTYANALMAATKFNQQVRVIDSLNASVGEKILCLYAIELIKQNKTLDEIEMELNTSKHQIEYFATVDTLEYLKRGGRVTSAIATISNILSIKPIISVIDGEVIVVGKAVGLKRAYKLMNSMIKKKNDIDFTKPAILIHSGLTREYLDKYILYSKELWNEHLEQIKICILGSTIGTHVGPNAIGVTFFTKNMRE